MQEIKNTLKKIIQDLYGLNFDPEVTPSPANINADYSSNAPLKLAKELHKNPMEIAEEVDAKFGAFETVSRNPHEDFEVSEPCNDRRERTRSRKFQMSISAPGFLNFILPKEYLSEKINQLFKNFDENIKSDNLKGKTVICEFSDPNPFKVLHVGHLYTSIVGDSIARLYEYAGAKVIRANFGGDVGLHVAKTMYILQQKDPKHLTIEDIAKCYIEGTAAYDNDKTAHEAITKLNKEIYRINAAGEPEKVLSRRLNTEGGHGRVTDLEGAPRSQLCENGGEKSGRTRPENDLAGLYWKGRELSYDYFDQFYDSIGVHFDKYYPESTVANLGLSKVREQLKNGVYEMSDGAVIFNGEKFGLHTRVFINKEGVPTYEAKDVGLIFTKWQDYHFDKSIVITGSEQKDYMSVVLKSVEQYAPELVERTTHLTHGLVKLPGGVKMSSRKGNFLKAVDVLDMVEDALKSEYDSTNKQISLAATKYAFLKYKMGGQIIFDPKESVKMTGNSGPYLLYACVRAKKILTTILAQDEGSETLSRNPYEDFEVSEPCDDRRERTRSKNLHLSEKTLIKKVLEYKETLEESVAEMAPHKVANYLYELAQDFSRFYEHCPVIGSDEESERLKLVKIYLSVMTHGLDLLGITIPEEM